MEIHPKKFQSVREFCGRSGVLLGLVLSLIVAVLSGAGAQETAPSQPAPELVDTAVSTDVLAHRLVPLTSERLEALAAAWQDIVVAKTEEIAARQVELIQNPAAATEEAYQGLARLVEERAALFERYTMIVNALESKGGDPELVSALRAYRDSVLFSETVLASPKAIANSMLTWLSRSDGGLAIAGDIAVFILALIALVVVSRSARWLARRWIGRVPAISKLLQTFLIGAIYWLFLAVGLLFVLAALGVNITPLFALIGGASFILAFAFQDTLGNLASGLMIMINRPFDEGDYVIVGGVGGTVKAVSIVATTVATPDNQMIVIPNKSVWGNVITNVNAHETRRLSLVFGISYEDSIPEAIRVIEETVKAHPLAMKEPAPMIRVDALSDSSVNIFCRPWAKTGDYWALHWDLTRQVKEAFDSAGISIPYPQRDVHLKGSPPATGTGIQAT